MPRVEAEGVEFAVSYADAACISGERAHEKPVSSTYQEPPVIDRTPAPVSKVDQVAKPRHSTKRTFTEEQLAQAIQLFASGATAPEVSKATGLSERTCGNLRTRNRAKIEALRSGKRDVMPTPDHRGIPPQPGVRTHEVAPRADLIKAAEKMDEILRPPAPISRNGNSPHGDPAWPFPHISKRDCMEVVKAFSKPVGVKVETEWLSANLGIRLSQLYLVRDQFSREIEELIPLSGMDRSDAITKLMARWKKTWPEEAMVKP